jgi:hypothetical protein
MIFALLQFMNMDFPVFVYKLLKLNYTILQMYLLFNECEIWWKLTLISWYFLKNTQIHTSEVH